MRYAIITNPASGRMDADQKRFVLAEAAKVLNAKIHGLDTTTADELGQCTRDLASHHDVIVAAGGDGTLGDVINAVDTTRMPVAYLPLGTGNAMRHALKYKGSLADIAKRIRSGKIREFDLINCDATYRAFTVSIGLEGTIIKFRDQYVNQGAVGFKPYFKAVLNSYFKKYKRTHARVVIDDAVFEVEKLLSLMVVKHPYYGYGMNIVPQARFDDRQLHICCLNPGLVKAVIGGITAFTIGNRIGRYHVGQKLNVEVQRPLTIQVNGNAGWESDVFRFTLLPKGLKIKC